MAWTKFFDSTVNGITIGVNKSFFKGKGTYSVKLGVITKGPNGESILSPNIPWEALAKSPASVSDLVGEAGYAIAEDIAKDEEADRARVRDLTTPSTVNPQALKGLKAVGKTAKKKAKLEMRKQV
jgi:hypothetical protein